MFPVGSEWEEELLSACLNDSLYIHQTTGVKQKLVYGTWTQLPEIMPWSVLAAKGWQPATLSAETEIFKRGRFGSAERGK